MEWCVVFGVRNRPFHLIAIGPNGVEDVRPPRDLVDFVVSQYGPFDETGGLTDGEFAMMVSRRLTWPR